MTRRVLIAAVLVVITSVPVFSGQGDILPQKDCLGQYFKCMTTTCPLPGAPDCDEQYIGCLTDIW